MLRFTRIASQEEAGRELRQILQLAHVTLEEAPNFLKVLANSAAAFQAYTASEKALRACLNNQDFDPGVEILHAGVVVR